MGDAAAAAQRLQQQCSYLMDDLYGFKVAISFVNLSLVIKSSDDSAINTQESTLQPPAARNKQRPKCIRAVLAYLVVGNSINPPAATSR